MKAGNCLIHRDLQTILTLIAMKHIMNVLKNEIFKQHSSINGLVKKVAVSQESYLKNRSNEALFNIWSENVKDLQKVESNVRYLRSAYATICNACEVEPLSVEEILAEKDARVAKKAAKKDKQPKAKDTQPAEETKESQTK